MNMEDLNLITIELLKALEHEDDLGMVIRAHMRIEQCLNFLIESKLDNPRAYSNQGFISYKATVALATAQGLDPKIQPFLNKIGSLRNKFAHRVNRKLEAKDVQDLYSTLDPKHLAELKETFNTVRKESTGKPVVAYEQLEPHDKFTLIVICIGGLLINECSKVIIQDN